MDDDDTILIMYPASSTGQPGAMKSINGNADRPGYIQGEQTKHGECITFDQDAADAGTRPATPEADRARSPEDGPGYRLTFSAGAKTRIGFVVGTSPGSDFVVLNDDKSVSAYHFAFQFDAKYRLVAKDLHSTRGTSVRYDGKTTGPRVGRGWVLSGCPYVNDATTIVISIAPFYEFLVKIPRHDIGSPEYRSKVDQFRQCANASATDLLRDVQIESRVPTAQPSNAVTPSELLSQPFIMKPIGQGAFATVYRWWNAETGDEMAIKRPRPRQLFAPSAWRREADLLSKTKHVSSKRHPPACRMTVVSLTIRMQPNIIQLFHADFNPQPVLYLEYVSGGSLADHLRNSAGFSTFETSEVLYQITDILAYLEKEHIVHRDVSTNNILVSQRNRDGIVIKLTDFGLSKESEQFTTICGHHVYLAPEIAKLRFRGNNPATAYTTAVDIWSAGVVIAELLCGLPKPHPGGFPYPTWPNDICDHVSGYQSHSQPREELAAFLLNNMLVTNPAGRSSAALCKQRAVRLLKKVHPRKMPDANSGELTIRPNADGAGEGTLYTLGAGKYITGITTPDTQRAVIWPAQGTAIESLQGDPTGVRRFLEQARDPLNSLFGGSAVPELGDGLFDHVDRTPIQSVVTVAAGAAGQSELPFGSLALPPSAALPSPLDTPTTTTPTATTPMATTPTTSTPRATDIPPPEYIALADLYDPTRPIDVRDVSQMWDEHEAQQGGQKRTR